MARLARLERAASCLEVKSKEGHRSGRCPFCYVLVRKSDDLRITLCVLVRLVYGCLQYKNDTVGGGEGERRRWDPQPRRWNLFAEHTGPS
jgi:hypothetical protein